MRFEKYIKMNTQTIDFSPVVDVDYLPNNCPSGITVEEWIDRLGIKLIDFYGEDFRQMLNQARSERGLLPL